MISSRSVPKNTSADTLEKARQKVASAVISNVYQYIIAGIIFVLFLRNVALRSRLYLARRRRQAAAPLASTFSDQKITPASSIYVNESRFYRVLGAIDAKGGSPVGAELLGVDCTWLRLVFSTFICALNLTFCLIIDTKLKTPATVNSNIARAFSRRCGRIAIANFPILFILAGRSNLVTLFTGFSYQDVKFYHKLVGSIVILECFVHTIAYTGYYATGPGMEKLYEEYTELYFKMGIMGMVAGAVIGMTAMSWFRRRWYEVFLALHVGSAALFLAGSWYHRPTNVPWVYAAVAFWAFERVCRLTSHLAGVLHARVILRRPLLVAEATVVSGAILLKIPFPHGSWEAGQHCYISFWGRNLITKPWHYGQSHPFSIANIPSTGDEHELRFVLRIKDGVTRAIADHIIKTTVKTGQPAKLTVSVEGPYGRTPCTEHYASILLVAGGSGITHIASLLEQVVRDVKDHASSVSSLRIVWAIHHLDQSTWIGNALEDARVAADAAGLDLKLDLYITQPGPTSADISKDTSPSTSPDIETPSLDEEKTFEAVLDAVGSRAVVHRGRPVLGSIARETLAESTGCSLVVGDS